MVVAGGVVIGMALMRWRERRQPLKWFQFWSFTGWGLVGLVVYLSLTSEPVTLTDIHHSDKVGHLVAYFVLMSWFTQLYVRDRHGWILVAVVGLGITLEAIQGQTGFRMFDYADMAANGLGALGAWLLAKTPCSLLFKRLEDFWL